MNFWKAEPNSSSAIRALHYSSWFFRPEGKSREKFSPAQIEDFQVTVRVGEYARKVQLFYRFDAGQPFQSVAMADDGAHEDGQANDAVFGVLIKPRGRPPNGILYHG
ncbi:MAG: hypothetical protein IPJ00_20630 [Saprospirales bacterium]|nr:hypothetical protein [Saprospirales bacterium]